MLKSPFHGPEYHSLFFQWDRGTIAATNLVPLQWELQAFVYQKLSVWELKFFSVQPQLIFWWHRRYTLICLSLGKADKLRQLPSKRPVPGTMTCSSWKYFLMLWFPNCCSVSHVLWPEGAEKTGSKATAMQWLQGTYLSSLWVRGCLKWGKSWRSH